MMTRFFWTLLFLTFLSPDLYAADPKKTFNAQYYSLENGMEIVVIPNHRAPVVAHMVWYRAGAADEPAGKSGIAHFLEHLMFKGSRTIDGRSLAPGEFSETVKRLGGRDNAFTSYDYTAYFQSIAKDYLKNVMQMEAGRMRGLQLSETEILSERDVIIEERRQRTDNDPAARFNEQMNAARFVNHPYGVPIIGWKHEMETLNAKDARDFYDRFYVPSNAILVVSGDVSGDEVLTLAQQTYGRIPTGPKPSRIRPQLPSLDGGVHITTHHDLVRQPRLQKLYLAPTYRSDKTTALALQILQEIMSGGSASRLYQSLVVDQKLAVNTGMWYDPSFWDTTDLYIFASPAPDISLDVLDDAIDAEIQKLLKHGITREERQDAINRLQDQAIYSRDSLMGPAMIFGRALVTGSSVEDVEYWPQNLETITTDDILKAAKQTFDPKVSPYNPPASGYLMPAQRDKTEAP